jgi:serine O-acetyltransferase
MREELKLKGRLPGLIKDIVASYARTTEINHLECTALPDREKVVEMVDVMLGVLYPGYFGEKGIDETTVEFHIGTEVEALHRLLFDQISRAITHECKRLGRVCTFCEDKAEEVAIDFLAAIPSMREMLALDVQAAYDGDPAAKSLDEIIFSYPGMFAITVYRIAHELYRLGVPLIPRMMTEHAHTVTGIDIHPGARIGKRFFIDHGTGVVIGETTEIGENVKLYQGVTLGALSFPKDEKGNLLRGTKRHPTLEDNVTIYSGATILGGETTIGTGSVVGGNVWLTHSIEPGTKVVIEDPQLRFRGPKGEAEKPAPAKKREK